MCNWTRLEKLKRQGLARVMASGPRELSSREAFEHAQTCGPLLSWHGHHNRLVVLLFAESVDCNLSVGHLGIDFTSVSRYVRTNKSVRMSPPVKGAASFCYQHPLSTMDEGCYYAVRRACMHASWLMHMRQECGSCDSRRVEDPIFFSPAWGPPHHAASLNHVLAWRPSDVVIKK